MTESFDCKLRLVQEDDIPILYEILNESLIAPNASVNENPLPPLEESKKFVLKYLNNNQNHEYDKWYVVLNIDNTIIGQVVITKKNYISYTILSKFRKKGYGEKAIRLLIKLNPRKRYFATINQNNIPSLKLIKKFGFKPKATVYELKT